MSQVKVLLNILHKGQLITAGTIISENDLLGADVEDLLARGLVTKNITSEEAEAAQTTTEPEAPVEPEVPTEPANPEAGTAPDAPQQPEGEQAGQQTTEETQTEQPATETTETGVDQQPEQPTNDEQAGNQAPVDQPTQ